MTLVQRTNKWWIRFGLNSQGSHTRLHDKAYLGSQLVNLQEKNGKEESRTEIINLNEYF